MSRGTILIPAADKYATIVIDRASCSQIQIQYSCTVVSSLHTQEATGGPCAVRPTKGGGACPRPQTPPRTGAPALRTHPLPRMRRKTSASRVRGRRPSPTITRCRRRCRRRRVAAAAAPTPAAGCYADSSARPAVRVRPLNGRERTAGAKSAWKVKGDVILCRDNRELAMSFGVPVACVDDQLACVP